MSDFASTEQDLPAHEAYALGYLARERGDLRNPFQKGTPQHEAWIEGHNRRDEELAW